MRPRLSSGICLGTPLPVRLFNGLGPVVRRLGVWPRIDPEKLMRAVERKSGRVRLPDVAVRALAVRADAFSTDAKLTLFGTLSVRGVLHKKLSEAVQFERLIAANPQILNEQVRRPLFVLGLPRTGTTLLQRLLSLHSGARYLPFWEGATSVAQSRADYSKDHQRRIRSARRSMALLNWINPDLTKIHPMGVQDPEECFLLFGNYFVMPPGYDFAYLPSYWDWYDEQVHLDAYRMHKRQLQALQWLDRREHWVLKCPSHLWGLKHLIEVYPDARIVRTHRDPRKVVPALCSLLAAIWSMSSDDVDLKTVASCVMNWCESGQQIASEALAHIPRDQVVDVDFDDLVADPVATAMSVYERFGYRADADLSSAMAQWCREHPSEGSRHFRYEPADFGLDLDDVARRLAPDAPPAGARVRAHCRI
jgi:Sulfotransferase family